MLNNHSYSVYFPYNDNIFFLGTYKDKSEAVAIFKISDSFEYSKNLFIWFHNYENIYQNIKHLCNQYLSDINISLNKFIDSVYNDKLGDLLIDYESAKKTVIDFKLGYMA